ncbi:MAG TPA: peptidylprolyl isomerase [Longimicrobium sp.]|jgi:peptidyl-prolyl cis-trans isomerase D|uniref:peptidylprolyl isomerase n=1 Tax=Longimicrobium sp. TaxID=2029185 RepID=UPI002ED99B56
MMQFIRSNVGKVLVWIIIPAFLAWMVFQIGMDVLGQGNGSPTALGRVNRTDITVQAYNDRYNQLVANAQQQGADLTPDVTRRLREQAWEGLVTDALLSQEMDRRGIRVTDAEVVWASRNIPFPGLAQQEIFQTNGTFDLRKYQQFLSGPQMTPQMYAELEMYFRQALPREKLAQQLSAGRYVSDAELWRAFQDRTETATVDYVSLPLEKLAPTAPTVTDAEVREYYEAHRDDFKRQNGARLQVAYIPLTITEADRQATVRRAQELRAELAAGADFAEVARTQSDDKASAVQGGSLGTFTRGQMVPQFDSAVFSLPLNEISQPVVSQFGVHLIQVQERTGDQAKARHILLSFQKSDEAVGQVESQLKAIAAKAPQQGLRRASQGVPGVVYREDVSVTDDAPYAAGIGSAAEALDWASTAEQDRASGEGTGVSDVLESEQAMYVVQLKEYHTAGEMSLAEATPQIRERLVRRKRTAAAVAAANQLVARIASGQQTLEQVAQANGAAVQRTGPFTRVDANPVFGQANAAIGAAFGTPLNRVGPVADTPAGLFLIRPVARTQADRAAFDAQKAMQRHQAVQAMQQDMFNQWLSDARKAARIRDDRAKLLRQS